MVPLRFTKLQIEQSVKRADNKSKRKTFSWLLWVLAFIGIACLVYALWRTA